jgi:hypothetical protein
MGLQFDSLQGVDYLGCPSSLCAVEKASMSNSVVGAIAEFAVKAEVIGARAGSGG